MDIKYIAVILMTLVSCRAENCKIIEKHGGKTKKLEVCIIDEKKRTLLL